MASRPWQLDPEAGFVQVVLERLDPARRPMALVGLLLHAVFGSRSTIPIDTHTGLRGLVMAAGRRGWPSALAWRCH